MLHVTSLVSLRARETKGKWTNSTSERSLAIIYKRSFIDGI